MQNHQYEPRKTMALDNQFTFTCPVFGAATKIAACFELEGRVKMGEKLPVRKGCQVAMACGKCPIDVIAWDMVKQGSDPYVATDTKLRSLLPEHMLAKSRVAFREDVMAKYDLTPAEIAKMQECNKKAASPPPKRAVKAKTEMEAVPAAPAPEPATPTVASPDVVNAAMTGDMTAAINAETETKA